MTKLSLIIGLGNPGAQYTKTRHNAGFWWVDQLAETLSVPWEITRQHKSVYAKIKHSNRDIRLLKPATFMNLSGQALAASMQYYKIPLEAIMIVHDDLGLPVGRIQLKQGGGHGGHNGVRDIIKKLDGQRNFYRLRIGIGYPQDQESVKNYVLNKPSSQECQIIQTGINDSLFYIDDLLSSNYTKVMNQLHQR